jgi:transcriptional regulator with XRE-family HTH domain
MERRYKVKTQFDALKFSLTCKIWRNMNGFTQRDVSASCGIATSTYAFIETGDRPPTMAEFSHLCAIMGFEASEFFKKPETSKNA